MDKPFPIHARTVTGLEEVLAEELSSFGAQDIVLKNRVVTCVGELGFLYKANLWCRTAIRVLRPLASFPARGEKALYEGIRSVDWSQWMSATGTLAIDTAVSSSFTTHSLFVSQLAKDAIVDQFREKTGDRPSVDLELADLRIVVSLFQNEVQVFLDSSGESLHKRGYRQKAGEAPINEVLAAGILKLSGWDPSTPLLDAMTGAGTFCIEAGLMARNIAPGLLRRHYGFQNWPDYDAVLFASLLKDATQAVKKDLQTSITGIELNPEVVQIARHNVEKAGLSDLIKIEQGDFFTLDRSGEVPGTLVMNPPYDERLGVENVADLYEQIGDRLKQNYAGWSAFVLSGNLEAVKYIRLRSSKKYVLFNGAIETRLLKFEMRARESEGEPRKIKEVGVTVNPKWLAKAETFRNRLVKNVKNYGKWAERQKIQCYRLYDWDIPELPFVLEVFGDCLRFEEIPRNQEHSPIEHTRYQKVMVKTAADLLEIPLEKIFFSVRDPRAASKLPEKRPPIAVQEGDLKFLVRIADPLDVGLELSHRKTRALIRKEALGKDFLSLYAGTGGFTISAAAGGAKSTTSIDTSGIFLEWAEKNLQLNGFSGAHSFLRSDIFEYLENTTNTFDLCTVEPPGRTVQGDHADLIRLIKNRLRPGGKIYFTTNFKAFECEVSEMREVSISLLSLDFERKPTQRMWVLET